MMPDESTTIDISEPDVLWNALSAFWKENEVFQRPMRLQPDKAVLVTNAGTALHNYVKRRDGHLKIGHQLCRMKHSLINVMV